VRMKAAAQTDGITPPDELAPKEKAQLEILEAAEDDGFDEAYLSAQATAHDEAVALFESFSTQGEESALRAFAAETLPTLQEHQTAVHDLHETE
jgi:putative membrane protein